MRVAFTIVLGTWLVVLHACGDSSAPPPTGGRDGGGPCATHRDCDDGVYCNGAEVCDPTAPAADARGCRPSSAPCPPERCIEAQGRCDETCPDADEDGFTDAACGGMDCDDADPERYPGATEVCDGDDEDCDPTTLGDRDEDEDGFVDDACCNGEVCGDDCDDQVDNVHRTAPEVCDGVDQDCDLAVDEGVLLSIWPDADNDGWGDRVVAPTEMCTRPAGTADRGGDCDDDANDVSPVAPESCDGVDEDCDGAIDEGMDEPCQAGLPEGTLGGCFAPADGSTPACRPLACEAGWFDCDGLVGNGCEIDLCTSSAGCDRCGRTCGLGCDMGICAGEEVYASYEGTVADASGTPIAGATVAAVDTCRSVGATTGADGSFAFDAIAFAHARVEAAGFLPELRTTRLGLRGGLRSADELDGWFADPDVAFARDADKGVIIVRLPGGGFRVGGEVRVDATAGPGFVVVDGDATPATSIESGQVFVVPNVTPGVVRVDVDPGPGCNLLCEGGTASDLIVLVEPGASTAVDVPGCFVACASEG